MHYTSDTETDRRYFQTPYTLKTSDGHRTPPELREEPLPVQAPRFIYRKHICSIPQVCSCLSRFATEESCSIHGTNKPKAWKCTGCARFLPKLQREFLIQQNIITQFEALTRNLEHTPRNSTLRSDGSVLVVESYCRPGCMKCKLDLFFSTLRK